VQAAIFNVLNSNAPSESICFVIQSQGNVFNSFPDNGAKNVSTKNHPQIAKRISPVPIKVCVNVNECLKVKWTRLRIIMF
jgi:hypothetical protein